ncbi:3-methyladenine DNA glycosylase/8-oxoguanine DNA glycosylase [Glaciihabitans tibetensis]|uniref:3-methyladenine DNA glycosylase/8-oxoguanine DNA glycosylase n=1 Tax=Glaciihabitans tibetensis TaxID=1266600 RepID=A0A2T0VCH5_9MICO|nr:DNA-3-methyladenine glycosylase 2 family protein [Glaciihabitans tibetensis]PRY67882.1 3-methyladenine DNA glycosylase/8-oxoguanine DNA glycosylase [Glaciihabitans tibetensis]
MYGKTVTPATFPNVRVQLASPPSSQSFLQPSPPLSTVYEPADPVNLRQTLGPLSRGAGDPTLRWDGRGVWRTLATADGPATLHLAQADGITATAWGPGAERAIAGVPELCGHGDDWSELDVSGSPFLAEARRRAPGLKLLRTNAVFEALVPAILEQKVTGVEARRSWRQLVLSHGTPAPGPAPDGMRVIPDAHTWRHIPSWEWHRAGVGPQRSQTILRVAAVASSLERTLTLGRGGPEVAKRLRSLPGVGIWTAAETTQRSHGDADAPSVGDYHLPSLVGWALIGKPVDDDGMLELLAPWAGHRQRIMRLIAASGVSKPRFGPRITIQDHRGH